MLEYFTDIIKVIMDTDSYFDKEKTDTLKEVVIHYIKNGFYIPVVYFGLLYFTQNLFLSTVITVKLYPANHYYWFGDSYSYINIPKQYNWVKQFVRFTDTGHLVSLLYLMDHSYYPLAHNVHFFITTGFWVGKLMGSEDQDIISELPNSGIIRSHETIWSCVSHGLPYVMFLREMILSKTCYSFDLHTIWLSYQWNYMWLVFIYVPWRVYTGDMIYSILDLNQGYEKPVKFFLFLHLIVLIANSIGYGMTYFLCIS